MRASSPAPTSTAGFEVLVQLVIAAIRTAPSASANEWPPEAMVARPVAFGFFAARSSAIFATLARYAACEVRSGTRSCGRFGPARLGSTLARSSSRTSLYSASRMPFVRHMPWARA